MYFNSVVLIYKMFNKNFFNEDEIEPTPITKDNFNKIFTKINNRLVISKTGNEYLLEYDTDAKKEDLISYLNLLNYYNLITEDEYNRAIDLLPFFKSVIPPRTNFDLFFSKDPIRITYIGKKALQEDYDSVITYMNELFDNDIITKKEYDSAYNLLLFSEYTYTNNPIFVQSPTLEDTTYEDFFDELFYSVNNTLGVN